ncbi:GntR family transcriptional regulator [Paenibacillus terrigena]|uniref:GntR family transcriptional regulator n=1 Tax=Paenibacillus terrigena TaxID=369333 RepID=UPI00036C2CAE|nr:GntR family transcriptional regulator [Paenibacillus terrigena]
MAFELDQSKEALPLYIQIKQDLKAKILNGTWNEGDKIPNELDLCKLYDVSRTTVRDALNELVWEEYLIRRRAKGTYVLGVPGQRQDSDVYETHFRSFTHQMKELGKEAGTLKAEVMRTPASAFIAEQLGVQEGELIYEIQRVRGVGDTAIVFFKTYIHVPIELSLKPEDYYGSLYQMLLGLGIKVKKVQEYLEAVNPSESLQQILNIEPNQPILKRVRSTFNEQKHFSEYTECYYIGERYRYYLEFDQISK